MAVIQGENSVRSYSRDGRYFHISTESLNDLFMYEEPKTYYTNVYKDSRGNVVLGVAYHNKEDSQKNITSNYIKTIEITIP